VTCRGWREVVRARRDGFGDGPAVRAIHIELAPYVGALQQSLQLSIVTHFALFLCGETQKQEALR